MEGVELLEGEVFKQIIGFDDYYISNKGRCWNIKNKRFVGSKQKNGYIRASLYNESSQHAFLIHRLVLQYFGPPQPEGMNEVDHINHIRDDNRIENLRYVNTSENHKNRTSTCGVEYEYFDEIPEDEDDIIEVRDYGKHEFEDLYYANNYFYFDTGVNYRRLHINYTKVGSAFIYIRDRNNKLTIIYYTKFKRLYGLN